VKEEDTVTVGQDLLKLEIGGRAEGDKVGGQAPKAPAEGDQSKSSHPQPEKEEKRPMHSEPSPPPPASKPQEKPIPTDLNTPARANAISSEPVTPNLKNSSFDMTYGSREERRVFFISQNTSI
jgi:2-oxoglutarate dehydrogenase E2 component (dihydrolipoamide succinyltransferase)